MHKIPLGLYLNPPMKAAHAFPSAESRRWSIILSNWKLRSPWVARLLSSEFIFFEGFGGSDTDSYF